MENSQYVIYDHIVRCKRIVVCGAIPADCCNRDISVARAAVMKYKPILQHDQATFFYIYILICHFSIFPLPVV